MKNLYILTELSHSHIPEEYLEPVPVVNKPEPNDNTPPMPKPRPRPRARPNIEEQKPNINLDETVKRDINSEKWFHGAIAREKAEEVIKFDGDFLVRESTNSPGQYVLTGMKNGIFRHLLLIDPNGQVRLFSRNTFTHFSPMLHLYTS